MTCNKNVGGCGYEFCWICLGDWKKHGTSYYKCTFKKESDVKKDEENLNSSKKFLQRFSSYCEKYADHQKGQKYAQNLFKTIEKYKDTIVSQKNMALSELKFLDDAINTIIDCRRMLKFSYVFGYYLRESKEILLYEHNQYMLDIQTDRLHEMCENQDIPNIIKISNYEEFNKNLLNFRAHIVNLMSSIKNFKENLLREIEGKMEKNIDYDLLYGKKKI